MEDMDFEDVLAGIVFGAMVVLSTLTWLIQRYCDSKKHKEGN